MARLEDKRYPISAVAKELSVPPHLLRQWEEKFTQLKPRRDNAGRRYYLKADIEIARRIKQLLRHEQLTSKGASKRITQELIGEGRPKTKQEAVDLLDALESEIRGLLDLLGPD
ncbi:MAG: MerR family transcriptional regulator [Candidatus Hydrogenedentes bacterium]|nr:MerR family transcriptional regulator [Candidatus Hydrogenedentota bacterium]